MKLVRVSVKPSASPEGKFLFPLDFSDTSLLCTLCSECLCCLVKTENVGRNRGLYEGGTNYVRMEVQPEGRAERLRTRGEDMSGPASCVVLNRPFSLL